MTTRRLLSPHFTKLLQLATTLFVILYMLLIGGSFNATVQFRIQLVNAIVGGSLLLLWLAVRSWQRRRLLDTGLELPLAVFILVQWLTAFTSLQPRLSVERVVEATAWGLAFIVGLDLLGRGWPREYVINGLILGAVFITAQGLWEVGSWFAAWGQLGVLPPVNFRLNGFLGHPNLTAGSLNLLLPLVIARALQSPGRTRLAFLALALLMLGVEFFASSRGGWLGAVLALVTLAGGLWLDAGARSRIAGILHRLQQLPIRIRALSLAVILLGLALGSWLVWLQLNQASHSTRGYLWAPAWEAFLTHPLTGGGPGLYPWRYALSPHAHSLYFQILGDNGLLGIGAALWLLIAGALQLWRRRGAADRLWVAAFLGGYLGFLAQHLFDYLAGTPAFAFLFILFSALAFAPPERAAGKYPALLLALPALIISGFTAFSLPAAALNDQGVQLAAQNRWAEAGAVFEQAADSDPGFPLYWQNAAQAYTRAGQIETALPFWERAARDDSYWAVTPATLAVLQNDPWKIQAALDLTPPSYIFALNAGALFESRGETSEARAAYRRALDLKPATARALFWRQTPLRLETLAGWQAAQPAEPSSLTAGYAALAQGDTRAAIALFDRARAESPFDNLPYVALARAHWAAGDETRALFWLRAGRLLQTITLEQTLDFYVFDGDWAEAHGERQRASEAYLTAFTLLNDYTADGPGTYGYPQRNWSVYHRAALPSDLIPQFTRADITPELDTRFAKLAQWLNAANRDETACYILERVRREAPASESGRLWESNCHS